MNDRIGVRLWSASLLIAFGCGSCQSDDTERTDDVVPEDAASPSTETNPAPTAPEPVTSEAGTVIANDAGSGDTGANDADSGDTGSGGETSVPRVDAGIVRDSGNVAARDAADGRPPVATDEGGAPGNDEPVPGVDCSKCTETEVCWYTTDFDGALDQFGCLVLPAECLDDATCDCVNSAEDEVCEQVGWVQNSGACRNFEATPVVYCVSTLG